MELTEEFCNREYNNRALVPNFQSYFDRWVNDSKVARTKVHGIYDIAYGQEPRQTLDFFPARKKPPSGGAPLMVFIHGGYWRSTAKSDYSFLAPAFTDAGAALAVIEYRLCPQVSMEDLARDVLAAVTWAYQHAGHYGCNPHHLYVSGHSAGGHLTAMMLAAQWPRWHGALPADVVRGGVAISGLFDLEPIRRASFLNVDLKLTPASVARLSPAFMQPATHAPLITAVGGDESSEFKRQNAMIGERWAQVLHADVAMPGLNHFNVCSAFGDANNPLFRETAKMMGLN
jgi:arylformamidase